MKMTMYDYITKERYACENIIKNRRENLKEYIELMRQEGGSATKLLILATGSSVNAVNCAKYYMEDMLGLEVAVKIPFLFSAYDKIVDKKALALGVSQGGSSFSTIEAVKKAKNLGLKTVAVTSKMESAIAKEADYKVNIGCGEETVGYVTMGFSSTVMTLMIMALEGGLALGKISEEKYKKELLKLEKAVLKIDDVIERTDIWYEKNKNELVKGERFYTIACGPNYGVALESSTKFTETVRCPIHAYEIEEYLHGPNLELKKDYYAFYIKSEGAHEKRLVTLRDFMKGVTEHCFTISHEKDSDDDKVLALDIDLDENISPLLYVVPFQIIAYKLSTDKGNDLEKDLFKDFMSVLNIKVEYNK